MKLGEIIQRVQSLYSKGVQSDDSRLSSRHIYSKILTARELIIARKSKQKQKISDWNYQTISCVEMVDIRPHECPCAPYPDCSTVKRSKFIIPKVMADYNGNLIDYVMTIDSGDRFDFTNRTEMLHIKGNKYTANKRRYLIDKGYIYIFGFNTPKVIQMRALFSDPIEAEDFISLCTSENIEKCNDIFDMEFPIDGESIDTLIMFTVQELITFFQQSPVANNQEAEQEQQQQ